MRVAIVHDYLREYGGAERVVEAIHEIWPKAPLFTSFVDWEALGNQGDRFRDWDIRTSPIADNWLIRKFHSPLRFLAPKIWESFDLSGYDLVISSSGWFMCRGVRTGGPKESDDAYRGSLFDSLRLRSGQASRQGPNRPPSMKGLSAKAVTGLEKTRRAAPLLLSRATRDGPLHICYIHHPPRNLYGYATGSSLQRYWPVRAYATVINFFLRHYDWETAQNVDYFIANSKETARRVWKFYRRESTVMYPPVDINVSSVRYQVSKRNKNMTHDALTPDARNYFLSVGRLTYSKRVDVAIEAANKRKLPLKIVGTGAEEPSLRSIAGPTVEFLGSVSDRELAKLYAGAKALIFCALDEDFGMVPVEAMAHGVPVIALGQGGVLETVVEGNPSTGASTEASTVSPSAVSSGPNRSAEPLSRTSSGRRTGILFFEPTTESLIEAIERFDNLPISSKDCIEQAKKFNKERFQKELKKFVEIKLTKYTKTALSDA